MAVTKPVKVPQKDITSIDVPNFGAGWFTGDQSNGVTTCFIKSKDVELDRYGYMLPRRVLQPFLPDTIETTYQKFPVLWEGQLYYFTLDDGQVKFCQQGDIGWTAAGPPRTAATLTTALTGANNDLFFTAKTPGTIGNSFGVKYVTHGSSQPLTVTTSGNTIIVSLATTSGGAISSTGLTVAAAIAAFPASNALMSVANAPGNDGTGVVTVTSVVLNLSGGDNGTNDVNTNNGGFPVFQRVLNNVVCCNGTNGDKLFWCDLTQTGFPVSKFEPVVDPTTALTAVLANLTSGAFNMYYAYSYSSAGGETLLAPILTEPINIVRDQWQQQTSPASIKVSRPSGVPTNAEFWNLYVATSATGGTIQTTDMLQIAVKLDLSIVDFVDDGSLSINLGSIAPTDNGTDGPRVDHVIVEDGNPIYYGDRDNPYNIWIGGGGNNAMSLSVSNGSYLAQPEQGTNFYATSVVGFRNGQGIPSLSVWYSNTEGLSKQAVLQQQTVNYGDQSFTVWGVTEQHYGAAGVAAPNSMLNYNGKLLFWSTDGILSATTQPTVQNVISISSVSGSIDEYVRQVKNSAMSSIVGTGWNNKFMWLVPSNGFDKPRQILILDTNNKGVDGAGAWDTLDIPADWIGVISPPTDAAFVYLSIGNKTYKLLQGNGTYDKIDGVNKPFSTGATGPLMGMGGAVHNEWQANVQVMFNVLNFVGAMTIGVTYRNQNGKLKTKTKKIIGGSFVPSATGGWGDPGWGYASGPNYSSEPVIDDTTSGSESIDVRKAITIDDIFNEAQWFYSTDIDTFNNYKVKAVSYEGLALGVRPDLA